MDDFTIVVVGGTPPDHPPHPALTDIWPRVAAVLRHYAWLNTDEALIRAFQHGVVRDGNFLVPSLFGEGGDLCRQSYALQNVVFYRFPDGALEYFWVTAQLDRCYGLGALYFPGCRLVLSLYPFGITQGLMDAFERVRAGIGRPAPTGHGVPTGPVVVSGYFHIIHHLWNELPAVERAVVAGLAPKLSINALYQPLGPLEELFPELKGRVQPATDAELMARHGQVQMFTALGAWTIPAVTQARVVAVAGRHTNVDTLAEQQRFRARHFPVFWVSVKPPQRTCEDQSKVLAALIEQLGARWPSAGFLLDGVSFPWDFDTNGNYPGWFGDMLGEAADKTAAIMDDVVVRLSPAVWDRVRTVSRVSVMTEITWARTADFYVCHGGSMQNKVGWLHRIPGVVHSNTSFMAGARFMIPPVENDTTPTFFLPDDLIVDDDRSNYTAHQLARKDQNYRFVSGTALADFVVGSFLSLDLSPDRKTPGLAGTAGDDVA